MKIRYIHRVVDIHRENTVCKVNRVFYLILKRKIES